MSESEIGVFNRREATMNQTEMRQKYHELLCEIVDPGFADKRTDEEAHEQTMRHLHRMKSWLEDPWVRRRISVLR